MKKKRKGQGGFSLLEVIVSIALLGLLLVPISSGLLLSFRINAKSNDILQARLAVSSAVETLMAEGVENYRSADFPEVYISTRPLGGAGWEVTVSSREHAEVSVTAVIRSEEVRAP